MKQHKRVWNFSPGPAMLPQEVLEQAREELLDWCGMGVSVMELSHRSPEFESLVAEIKQDLRDLLALPSHYEILFTDGGGQGQFAFLPMNLLQPHESADYLVTGIWSAKCYDEASRFVEANLVATGAFSHYTTVPDPKSWQLNSKAKYFHYVANETVNGVQMHERPKVNKTLAIDMSSEFLTKPITFDQDPIIYAVAQKNFGAAGLTVVLLPKEWLSRCTDNRVPAIFSYKHLAESHSLIHTPPTFIWYLSGLVFKWLKKQGGLKVMEARNRAKAQLLYDCVDQSELYNCPVDKNYRSVMNVVFDLPDQAMTMRFLNEAKAHDLCFLKGHKMRGGIRASIYNGMPMEGVKALVAFMRDFEQRA